MNPEMLAIINDIARSARRHAGDYKTAMHAYRANILTAFHALNEAGLMPETDALQLECIDAFHAAFMS